MALEAAFLAIFYHLQTHKTKLWMVFYIPPKQSVPNFHVTRVQFFPLPLLSLEMYSFPLIISPLPSSLTNTNIDRKTDRQKTHIHAHIHTQDDLWKWDS